MADRRVSGEGRRRERRYEMEEEQHGVLDIGATKKRNPVLEAAERSLDDGS
jgi:hypothetical protein